MPDSPASITGDPPIVTSPGHLHISTSMTPTQLMIDGRAPISVATALPNGYHPASPNQPLSPNVLNGMQLPLTCGSRQLSKLKRFLTTLQQFGSDISPETGERVRGLIVGLVNNSITVEEFHQQLQEATNFPLRPFVIPFLKTNLPSLQQDIMQWSYLSKRPSTTPPPPSSTHTYTSPAGHTSERMKKEEEEAFFDRTGEKRKIKEGERNKENGYHADQYNLSPGKKKHTGYEGENTNAMVEQLMDSLKQDTDEWRNLESILQYIVTFVEKAKRSMSQLQERCMRDREEMASWARTITVDAETEIKRRANDLVNKALKQTDDRVNEVKKRAEEVVSDVKRQAVVELQKAVNAAEEKANDALSQANQRMDKAVQEARRLAAEETSTLINTQDTSKENCWNCGRKANETCSGCSVARYCGMFCQHKDWDHHQKDCGKIKPKQRQPSPTSTTLTIDKNVDETQETPSARLTTSPRQVSTTNTTPSIMTLPQTDSQSNVTETFVSSSQSPTSITSISSTLATTS